MKKIISLLLCCAAMTLSATAGERAQPRTIDNPVPAAPCQDNMERDSMETVPATDDPAPVLIPTSDAACKVPQAPIST